MLRAMAKRIRGKRWEVTIRDAGRSHDIVLIKGVATKERAVSEVAELARAIETGVFPERDE
jgi:hypothetical protein